MARPVTLFSGQWADLPFAVLCQKARSFGFDGIELPCQGDPMDAGVVELEGLRSSSTFNYKDNTFTPTSPMKYGRWYPGMVVQPDGSVLVFSGASQMTNKLQFGQVRRVEKFDPAANTWTEQYTGDASENELPMQPRMFLTPSGKSFYTGVGQMWGPFGQAADDECAADAGLGAHLVECVHHLAGQFPGWDQHNRLYALGSRLLQTFKNRQQKGERLPGPGLGGGEHVPA